MEIFIAYTYRFLMYTAFGLVLEMTFSVDGIERALGCKVHRRVPKKYLEGFVSLYMIPLHGFGLLFLFEPCHTLVRGWFILLRFLFWAVFIATAEGAWGWILDRTIGFYPWDYYADSKYKVFKRGYTLWTLIPLWGIAGLILELYSDLQLYLSPFVVQFFLA